MLKAIYIKEKGREGPPYFTIEDVLSLTYDVSDFPIGLLKLIEAIKIIGANSSPYYTPILLNPSHLKKLVRQVDLLLSLLSPKVIPSSGQQYKSIF